MMLRLLVLTLALAPVSCSDTADENAAHNGRPGSGDGNEGVSPPKADRGQITDVDWANSFFLTQIYDPRWNPTGAETDAQSNNCGPASLAMILAQRGLDPKGLTPAMAMDHARAMMYAAYPDIDSEALPEGAVLYEEHEQTCISDADRPVYFDTTEDGPSIAQGIRNGGATPVFGYSWGEVYALLEANEGVIAYGHITDDWRRRFSGDYGTFGPGGIPHFIAVFLASTAGHFVVCDPMHLGGPVVMTQSELQTFFKSPVNVYETSLRVIAWTQGVPSEDGGPASRESGDESGDESGEP